MPTPFIMPKFDMDQESSRIVEWLKGEGDLVEIDEIVLVVETDKVAVDVPAPASGTLAQVTAAAGDEVPVATVIATILAEGEKASDLPPMPKVVQSALKDPGKGVKTITEKVIDTGRIVTPVAFRMISELGLKIGQIPAAGSRITKEDIERFLDDKPRETGRVGTAATPAARRLGREKGVDLTKIRGSGPSGRVQAADVARAIKSADNRPVPERPADRVRLTGIRRTMAERMQASSQTAPHIFLSVEMDVTHLEKRRAEHNRNSPDDSNISLTALLVTHLAQVLGQHPYLNASLIGEEIYLWHDVNIGVATAVDDGLVVPVIHHADQKGIAEINTQLKELSRRARGGKLELKDVHGGTFTLSNLGMYGIDQFQAIINPPESAILAVGRLIRKPVVVDDSDSVIIRPMVNLTLSADHRVIDGVTAAGFLNDLKKTFEAAE